MISTKLENNDYARMLIEAKGLCTAILGYVDSSIFEDNKTRKLWKAVNDSFDNLYEYLDLEKDY